MTKESTYTAKLPEPDGTYLYTRKRMRSGASSISGR